MKKIIFLFLVFAVSSPAWSMNWDELTLQGWNEQKRIDNRTNANRATLDMAKSFLQAHQGSPALENPYDQRNQQADLAVLRSLVNGQYSLTMPPDLLSQRVAELMGRIDERNWRQGQRQRDTK